MITAYLLALGVFIPVSGWMADRFGARLVFSAAIALFTVSSGLCALSANLVSSRRRECSRAWAGR